MSMKNLMVLILCSLMVWCLGGCVSSPEQPKINQGKNSIPAPFDFNITSATLQGVGEVSLEWEASSYATNYVAQDREDSVNSYTTAATTKNTNYTVTCLTCGLTYVFKITALNVTGCNSSTEHPVNLSSGD